MIPSSPYSPPALTVARVAESGTGSAHTSREIHEGGAALRAPAPAVGADGRALDPEARIAASGPPSEAHVLGAASPAGATSATASATSPSSSLGHAVVATVVSLFFPAEFGERVIASGGALIESVLMAAELLAGDDGRATRPVQLGWFERPRPAFELKSELTPHFDRVAVARFDPPAGTFFSVRVFDAATGPVPSATARAAQGAVTTR